MTNDAHMHSSMSLIHLDFTMLMEERLAHPPLEDSMQRKACSGDHCCERTSATVSPV